MNKNPLAALLLSSALLPLPSFAEGLAGVYVAPRLGYGSVHRTYKNSDGEKIDSQTKSAAVLGLAAGYDFKKALSLPMRLELEYARLGSTSKKYHFNDGVDAEDSKITLGASTLFANAYFDFHNPSAFTPYVSVGLGFSSLSAKASSVGHFDGDGYDETYGKKTTTNFAWNLGVGAAWNITDRIALDLGYRYASLGKAKTKPGYDNIEKESFDLWVKAERVTAHQFLLGARFTF
jgi:opacity protein-like surface antigen